MPHFLVIRILFALIFEFVIQFDVLWVGLIMTVMNSLSKHYAGQYLSALVVVLFDSGYQQTRIRQHRCHA